MRYSDFLDRYPQCRKFLTKEWLLFVAAVIAVCFYAFFWSAPRTFPAASSYDIKPGQTYTRTAYDLRDAGAIRSPFWFKTFVYVFSLANRRTIAGDYALYAPQNVFVLAWRFSHGYFDTKPVKITLPEGISSFQMADIYAKYLPSFNAQNFLDTVKQKNLEGYLFPDTYFFLPDANEQDVIGIMHDNFDQKISALLPSIKAFGKSESDVLKMASILEDEASTDDSRKIIAGILWKRVALGMPLQVDSSFKYIDATTTTDLSAADLQPDSPYNSYTHRGLPPTPIGNPGLSAIEDAIEPILTPYLYFLSDNEGNMHYAATLAEQDANIAKYLK